MLGETMKETETTAAYSYQYYYDWWWCDKCQKYVTEPHEHCPQCGQLIKRCPTCGEIIKH
jgi:rRNA maturation endonuclease Nob1